jgi:predicted nucleotidyltransferase
MRPGPSSDSVKIISLNQPNLLAHLHEIAARIRTEHPEVEQVRLFGSLARGDATGISDVDVLILLRDSAEPDPLRRILTFLPHFDLDRASDLLVYTRAEFDRHLANSPFLRDIWNESVAL